MQVEELLQLSIWFREKVEKNNVLQNYSALLNKMNSNIRRSNGQPQTSQPFSVEKENLFESLNKIDFDELTIEQIKFLEKIGVNNLINKDAIKKITDDLINNNLDIATATSKIRDYNNTVTNAKAKFDEIFNLLSKSFDINEIDEIKKNEVLMRIYFQDAVAIKNFVDLKKLSNDWYEIARGITMSMNTSPEDFRVVGAKKGSLILDLAVVIGVAKVVSKILLDALKVTDRILDIDKKTEEIKAMKLKNKKIENDLKKESETEKENGIKIIVEETINTLGINRDREGDKINAIEKSVTKLIHFTSSGGHIDFVQTKNKIDEHLRDENLLLKTNIEEIRKLENKIKLLEEKNRHNI